MNNTYDDIYEPMEDSFLLEKFVKQYAFGNVLDMGTGSGIQGIAALNQGNNTISALTFADINSHAITSLKSKISKTTNVPINFVITDLFSSIKEKSKFDTIIFNPPYLPEDPYDAASRITTGGKKGYEILERFLWQSKENINNGGIILLVFSSLTNKTQVDKIIKSLDYDKAQLGTYNLFMEKLYAYILTPIIRYKGHRGSVYTKLHKQNMKHIKDKGYSKSYGSTSEIVQKKFIVCVEKSALKNYNSSIEFKFLKILNKYLIGPKILKHYAKKNRIIMEFAYGTRIIEYFLSSDRQEILNQINMILKQLILMDFLGINKLELTNPYKHILLSKSKDPMMIDFERACYGKPKNVTQFLQFLTSGRLRYIFREKNLNLDVEKLRSLAYAHKKKFDNKELDAKKMKIKLYSNQDYAESFINSVNSCFS